MKIVWEVVQFCFSYLDNYRLIFLNNVFQSVFRFSFSSRTLRLHSTTNKWCGDVRRGLTRPTFQSRSNVSFLFGVERFEISVVRWNINAKRFLGILEVFENVLSDGMHPIRWRSGSEKGMLFSHHSYIPKCLPSFSISHLLYSIATFHE